MLNYIQRNIPAGVGMEVKSFKLAKFPAEIEVYGRIFRPFFVTKKIFRNK